MLGKGHIFASVDWRGCFDSTFPVIFILNRNYRDYHPLCYTLDLHSVIVSQKVHAIVDKEIYDVAKNAYRGWGKGKMSFLRSEISKNAMFVMDGP